MFRVFQWKEVFDHFHKFSKIFFNLLSNISTVPRLTRTLLLFHASCYTKLKALAPEREDNPVNASVMSIRTLSFPSLTYS